jgi:tetratricopeptide (TPR) repeat protein
MIRLLVGLLCLLLTLHPALPVTAQDFSVVTEEQFRLGEKIAEKAFIATNKGDFAQAEEYWSQLIAEFPDNPAVWSNRGNTRLSQNKLDEAIVDFNQAITLAPELPDAYLNRGAAFERKELYEEAMANYNRVLEINPQDPMAYNNLGSAKGAIGQWEEALADYQKAIVLEPLFSFARSNVALAMYQVDRQEEAIKIMRDLVRKYPMFADARASLTAVLWAKGLQGEAESNWVATVGLDTRYQDLDWVKNIRRWPPKMVTALQKFLELK